MVLLELQFNRIVERHELLALLRPVPPSRVAVAVVRQFFVFEVFKIFLMDVLLIEG